VFHEKQPTAEHLQNQTNKTLLIISITREN